MVAGCYGKVWRLRRCSVLLCVPAFAQWASLFNLGWICGGGLVADIDQVRCILLHLRVLDAGTKNFVRWPLVYWEGGRGNNSTVRMYETQLEKRRHVT